MPIAAPHPCGNRRCSALAPRGERFCDVCRPLQEKARHRADRERRGSSHERGYGSPWRATVERIKRRDGKLCLYCKLVGWLTEMALVDHIRAKAAGGTDDDANLASCCTNCHTEKSVKHDGWFGHELNPIDRIEQFVPTWHPAESPRSAA